MNAWLWLLLGSLLASGFFSGSETAVVSSSRLRQRAARERGRLFAGLAERLHRRPEHTLVVLLLGTNLANVLASISALMITERGLHRLGLNLPAFWSDLLSSLWVAALVLVAGEVLPKNLGRLYALRITRFTAPLLLVLSALLRPLFWLFDLIGRLLRFLTGRGFGRQQAGVSWETVRLHLDAGRAQGVVGEREDLLIRRVALLNRLTAESLMTPLAQLDPYPVTGTLAGLRRRLAEKRASWSFLYEGRPENLVGLLPARRLLAQREGIALGNLATKPRRVPAHRPLLDLIDELQLTRSKLAVVTDLAGHCLGAVFLEDLLRQLVHFRRADQGTVNGIHPVRVTEK